MKSILITCLLAILSVNVHASCDRNLTSNSGSFHSPNYPNKYDQGECHYTVTISPDKAVKLNWKSFNVGPAKQNNKCPGDSVWVYDGTVKAYNGIIILCGQDMESITSSGETLTIVLKSNTHGKYSGFSASYTTTDVACNAITLSTDSAFIASPNYPNPYPSNSNCLYKIQLPATKVLALGWFTFDIEGVLPGDPCTDYVEIYDQHPSESDKVYRYCQFRYNPPEFTSSGNVAYLRFVSSSLKNTRNTGFVAYYRSGTRKSCNVDYSTPTGIIAVPDIASLKGKDLSCKINIVAKYSDYINLKWIEFGSKLFTNPNSCQNSIEIYDGQTTSSHLVSKKCNSNIGPKFQINGSNAMIHYNIKNYQTNKNFRLKYQRVITGISHTKITILNATCNATETYHNTPDGRVYTGFGTICSTVTISVLPLWAFILIMVACGLIVLGIVIGIVRCIRKGRSARYDRLHQSITTGTGSYASC